MTARFRFSSVAFRTGTEVAVRAERAALASILALALVLRVVYVLQMRQSPFFLDPALDQLFFVDAARGFANGVPVPSFRAPLYSWWLGILFRVFGDGLLLPRLLQCVAGTAAVWLVYRVGRLAFDRRVGLVAALFAATYWVLLYYDGELLREALVNPLNLVGMLATLTLAQRPSASKCVLAGSIFGLSMLLRPQVVVVVPLLAAWLLLHSRIGWRRVLAFAAAVAIPVLPVMIRDRALVGDALAFTAEGGQALWSGNNPAADGVTSMAPGQRADFWGFYEDSRAQAELAEGRPLVPSDVSRYYVAKTLGWFQAQPATAVKLLLAKLRLFATDWEFGNPEEPRFFAERFAPIVEWLPLGFGLVIALAAVGLFSRRRGALVACLPVWGFVLVYGATVVLTFVTARFRLPVIPFLLILAAQGLVWLAEQAVARRALALGGGVLLAGLVFAGARCFPVPRNASIANGTAWLGIAEARAGHRERAIALFEEALRIHPSDCDTHVDLGATLLDLKRVDEALAHFERAVELCPENVQALDALSDILLRVGRTEQAGATAERSIRVAPHLARARYNVGRCCIASGRAEDAAAAFRAALERKPDYFNAAYALGMLSLDLHRTSDAIDALSRAVANGKDADPEFLFEAYGELIKCLAHAGRREEAREKARRMVEQFPEREEARRILAGL